MYQVLNCLGYEHDLRLVALAGAVCLLACAVAVSLFHRARASQGRTRLKWMALDTVAAGCGIWATHFIAMLAYDPAALPDTISASRCCLSYLPLSRLP
jgi:NO-binding membrane sensor protein with MHYT domain